MSINQAARYPVNSTPPDASYPFGSAKNSTTPGAKNGTPWEKDQINDIFGYQQALLSKAGIIPSGIVETSELSQYLQAAMNVHGVHHDTLADMTADETLLPGMFIDIGERTIGNQGGGRWKCIVTGTTVNVDLPNTFGIVVSDNDVDISFVLQFNSGGWVNARQFGNTGEAINAALAVANYVYATRGTYLTSTVIAMNTNQFLIGEGFSTNIQGTADGVPSKIIEFNNASKANIQNLNVTWIGSSDIGVSVFESDKCNILGIGGNYLNQDSGAGITGGTFVRLDMGTNPNAVRHTMRDCDSQGADIYVESLGPLTTSIFDSNKGRSANGFRFTRGTVIAGTAPIVGNRIINNLIQNYSAAVTQTGVGIDWGVGDAASPVHSFANFIHSNYIERWDTAILFRDGSANNSVGPNEYDNNLNDIVDSTAIKGGYTEFAGTKNFLKLARYKAEFTFAGIRFTDEVTGDITFDGTKIDKAVTSNGTTVSVNGRTLRLDGSGAPRTGTILGIPGGSVDGQRLILLGPTWSVTFLTTNIDIAAGFTVGNGSGEYSGIEFEWDLTNLKWMPIGGFLRP